MSIEEKLSKNKFSVDEGNPHIVLNSSPDPKLWMLLVKACPAGLYKIKNDNSFSFDYAGCLECGTCRVLAGGTAIESWNYPRGTFGVELRYG